MTTTTTMMTATTTTMPTTRGSSPERNLPFWHRCVFPQKVIIVSLRLRFRTPTKRKIDRTFFETLNRLPILRPEQLLDRAPRAGQTLDRVGRCYITSYQRSIEPISRESRLSSHHCLEHFLINTIALADSYSEDLRYQCIIASAALKYRPTC